MAHEAEKLYLALSEEEFRLIRRALERESRHLRAVSAMVRSDPRPYWPSLAEVAVYIKFVQRLIVSLDAVKQWPTLSLCYTPGAEPSPEEEARQIERLRREAEELFLSASLKPTQGKRRETVPSA